MREYASLKLRDAQEGDTFGERCLEYYRTRCLQSADQARYRLVDWLAWAELEIDNIRAVLHQCVARDDVARGLDVAASMRYYWITRGTTESVRWLDQLLASGEASARTQVRAYYLRGWLSLLQADPAGARPWIARAIATSRQTRHLRQLSESLSLAATAEDVAGEPAAARCFLDQAEALTPGLHDDAATPGRHTAKPTDARASRRRPDAAGACSRAGPGSHSPVTSLRPPARARTVSSTSRVSRPLSSYAAYVFDMDGTLTYHDQAIPGAAEALRALKGRGKHVLAVTNNSSLGQHALAERFRRFGLPLEDHEVFSALVAAARLVAHEQPGARVHVFGNPGLRSEIERRGLVVTDTGDADYVVVGNHHGITYARLTMAMRALLRGARFVTVNMDRTYVGADGDLVPGCGAFAEALAYAAGRGPDVVVGKPSITLLCEAAESVDQPASACLYVGDNPEADIGGAHAAGMDALLVLTGVATSAAECPEAPEHVLPSVADLPAYL